MNGSGIFIKERKPNWDEVRFCQKNIMPTSYIHKTNVNECTQKSDYAQLQITGTSTRAQRTTSFCRHKDYFLRLKDKSIIKSFLHRITVTNTMVTTAGKDISESKETALPLRILSLPEEIQPAVLCCNPWILSPPSMYRFFGSLINSKWKNPTQWMIYLLKDA